MTRYALKDFVDKSLIPLSKIAEAINIDRGLLSNWMYSRRDISNEKITALNNFVNTYIAQWK